VTDRIDAKRQLAQAQQGHEVAKRSAEESAGLLARTLQDAAALQAVVAAHRTSLHRTVRTGGA
jgi:hypothetical protein